MAKNGVMKLRRPPLSGIGKLRNSELNIHKKRSIELEHRPNQNNDNMKSETEQSAATTNTTTITMTKPTTNKDRNDAITERLNSLGLSSEDSIDESLLDDSAKVVTFSDVQIREYPIIAGGGPTLPSSGGPPITIDWEYQYEEHVSVDMYEFCHPNTNRRHAKQLLLTPYHRARILFQNGISMNEIDGKILFFCGCAPRTIASVFIWKTTKKKMKFNLSR